MANVLLHCDVVKNMGSLLFSGFCPFFSVIINVKQNTLPINFNVCILKEIDDFSHMSELKENTTFSAQTQLYYMQYNMKKKKVTKFENFV